MSKNTDVSNILGAYENMYGSKNDTTQLNEALEKAKKDQPRKRKRRRGRKKQVLENLNTQTNSGQTDNIGEIKDMSKFNTLFNTVVKEQFEGEEDLDAMGGVEAGEEPLDDGMEGLEGEEEITLTIPRDMADKLCELIMSATGGDAEGEEFPEDDFGGGEDDFEEVDSGGMEESAEDNAEKLSTEPAVTKFTKGSNKAKATQTGLGSSPAPQAGGRGAAASQRPQTPKPAPKHHGG